MTRSVYPWIWRPLLPPALEETYPTANFEAARAQDVDYWRPSPEIGLCWAAPLPCTHELTHENIQLRDPNRGIGAGFVRQKILRN